MANTRNLHGPSGFQTYYQSLYETRWNALRGALEAPPSKIKRPTLTPQEYTMDEASLIAANALPVHPNDAIVDLCAAPGGKTLVLAEKLGKKGKLIANDLSRQRRLKLKKVISNHLPKTHLKRVEITGYDASRWCLHEKNRFDKVFLDAPCSSESHVLTDVSELAKWSPSRSKRLGIQQYALLASALQILKPQGIMVYCTCSINPIENDQVIEKLIDRQSEYSKILPPDSFQELTLGEATKHGWAIYPDLFPMGPIYFCVIQKTKAHEEIQNQ